MHGAQDGLAPLEPVRGLPGAAAALHLADVVPRLHPGLAVFQAPHPAIAAASAAGAEVVKGGALGTPANVAVLVVNVHHPRPRVTLAHTPPRLAPGCEGGVLVAERVLAHDHRRRHGALLVLAARLPFPVHAEPGDFAAAARRARLGAHLNHPVGSVARAEHWLPRGSEAEERLGKAALFSAVYCCR